MEEMLLGVTDRTVLVFISDPASTTGAGKAGLAHTDITVTYTRVETDNDVVHTDVTSSLNALTNLTDAHNDWGWKEVNATLSKGLYRLDIADAVFASGAWYAVVQVTITSGTAAATPKAFRLVAVNALDGVRMGLTALPNAAADAAGGLPVSDAGGLDLDAILADTNELQTDWANGGRLDLILDARASQTSVDTIDDLLDTEVAALTTELAKVPKSDGTATWNATALASIQSEANDALVAYDPPTKAELDAAVLNVSVDEIQATALADLFNTNSATTYASAVAGSVVKEIADNAGGSALTTDAIAEAMFTYNATATYATADAGSVVKQIADNAGGSSLTVGDIADAVWDEATSGHTTAGTFGEQLKTDVDAILADTDSLDTTKITTARAAVLTDWIDGGRLDLILDARASQTSVDDVPTVAEFEARTVTSATYATAANLATVAGYLDTEIAAILEDTGTTLPAQIAALNNLSAAQVRTELSTELARIDVATSTRMATYTQPTGFLAATFPTTVASTTNITAGTITTVTTLTNLPAITSNWLTAAGIAADAGTEIAAAVLAAAAADPIAANVEEVNAVALTGTGVLGDEWGPA